MSLWEEQLGEWGVFTCGHMSVMLKGRCRLEMSSREGLGESNVCEGNSCEVMPLYLQIYSSLFLWKGGCKLGAKWKPELVALGAHLAIPLVSFKSACMQARQWIIRLFMEVGMYLPL